MSLGKRVDELEKKLQKQDKNLVRLVENLPKIITNILLKEGIIYEVKNEEFSDEDILLIKEKLNEGNGPKIMGTKNMTETQFQSYYKQLKEIDPTLAKKQLKNRL